MVYGVAEGAMLGVLYTGVLTPNPPVMIGDSLRSFDTSSGIESYSSVSFARLSKFVVGVSSAMAPSHSEEGLAVKVACTNIYKGSKSQTKTKKMSQMIQTKSHELFSILVFDSAAGQ